MKNLKNIKKLDLSFIAVILFLIVSSVGLLVSNISISSKIENQKIEISTHQKQNEDITKKHQEVISEISKEQEKLASEIVGFPVAEMRKDEKIISDYLSLIFTWTSGDQYDEQRREIKSINAVGTDRILNSLMMENYRVAIPKDSKLKDNDIDINGLKSKLLTQIVDRIGVENSAVLYSALIEYQIYIDENDLSGKYKTTDKLLFTFEVSGEGDNRKISNVKYAFVAGS